MSLKPISQLMGAAQHGGYALGYFESWNLESLQGVMDAAERTRSPIILGFNGEFLSRAGRVVQERLPLYAAVAKAAAEISSVPCGLIFNECPRDEWVEEAIRLGFNLVMPADPRASSAAYADRVRQLTQRAHAQGVAVEAEVGELPSGVAEKFGATNRASEPFAVPPSAGIRGDRGTAKHPGSTTDPEEAARFVNQTGVDLLAVSVGNVHIQVNGAQPLDLDRLAAIRQRVSIPLVLHGGSGITSESLRAAIQLGVTKVNYGTYLKQRYLAAVRAALGNNISNPHVLLGMGGAEDVMVAGRLAVRDAVLERIELLGCCGKAGG